MTGEDAKLGGLLDLARGLGDGVPCEGELFAALLWAVEQRRANGDPPAPQVSGLKVRRDGLPDWWSAGDNLLLAADGVDIELSNAFGFWPTQGNVAVVGVGAKILQLSLPSNDSLIVIGDRAQLPVATVCACNQGSVLIGEDTTALWYARVDCRNAGAVMVGADGMWSNDVNLVTDDMHAIRSLETDDRVNGYGERIVVEHHVWLGEEVRVMGGARIGADTVVRMRSLVRGTPLPPNSVCAGSPAKPILVGTTWTREDLP